jgi:hypothetical protein
MTRARREISTNILPVQTDPDAGLLALVAQMDQAFNVAGEHEDQSPDFGIDPRGESDDAEERARFAVEKWEDWQRGHSLWVAGEALQARVMATPAKTLPGLVARLELLAHLIAGQTTPSDDCEQAVCGMAQSIAAEARAIAERCGCDHA